MTQIRFRFGEDHARHHFSGVLCGVQFNDGVSEVLDSERQPARYKNQGKLLMKYHAAEREELPSAPAVERRTRKAKPSS